MGSKKKKAYWTKQFYLWHWVSSALCLVAMLLFAITGITLNHAGEIAAEPVVKEVVAVAPAEVMEHLAVEEGERDDRPLPREVRQWLASELGVSIPGRPAEWSEFDVYLGLPRPGGDAWLSIDRETGELVYESTSRGAIAYLNDLHKGRNTGVAWAWFIDIFSVAAVIFCCTGLALLVVHARRRPSTWPVVLAGFAVPVILAVFFVH